MERYISGMPIWAITLFVISFILSLGMIAYPAQKAALYSGLTVRKSRMVQMGVLLFYLLWLTYASVLSLNGVFAVNGLPPRVMVLTAIPLLVILLGVVGNTSLFKRLLRAIPLESLVFMHVFRFLGAFFILLYFYKLLDPRLAISAGLGDIFTAIFAVPVARAVAQGKSWSRKAVYAWNAFGLLDVVSLTTIAIINAVNSGGTGAGVEMEMTLFPFAWFPAFAPATITFLHVAVFRKLRWERKKTHASA